MTDSYELSAVIRSAKQWRDKASASSTPDTRDDCLRRAALLERQIQRSLEERPLKGEAA